MPVIRKLNDNVSINRVARRVARVARRAVYKIRVVRRLARKVVARKSSVAV